MMNRELLLKAAKEYGGSFYLFDREQFINNYNSFKNAVAKYYPNFNIAYSYKTNYIPPICKIVNGFGGYAEVVSDMEMDIALKCGVPYHRIIWNGPIKRINRVVKAACKGTTINIDNLLELKALATAIEGTNVQINVGVRTNFDVNDNVVSRFGFDVESRDFDEALNIIKSNKQFKLNCLHCHFAKRSIEFWPERMKGIVNIVDRVEAKYGLVPSIVDLGGGIYGNMDEVLKKQFTDHIPSYQEYAEVIGPQIAKSFKNKNIEVVCEPGTALAADVVKFVGQVASIKEVRGKYFATLLASQKNINISGKNPPIEIIHNSDSVRDYADMDFVGYTCIEGDVLYKDYSGKLGIGDYVIFSNCGSYSIVMKPPFILPNVPILEFKDSQVVVIKRAETFEDLFKTYNF